MNSKLKAIAARYNAALRVAAELSPDNHSQLSIAEKRARLWDYIQSLPMRSQAERDKFEGVWLEVVGTPL